MSISLTLVISTFLKFTTIQLVAMLTKTIESVFLERTYFLKFSKYLKFKDTSTLALGARYLKGNRKYTNNYLSVEFPNCQHRSITRYPS